MASSGTDQDPPRAGSPQFTATRWSLVLAAGETAAPGAAEALEKLCCAYWYPLYAFVRRQGHGAHDAEDLTQGFFANLLERKALKVVGPEKGKFRSFLLASLKNFLANDWERQHAAKRGGKHAILSWDDDTAENRYLREPSHEATPEKLFERSWALTVIESAMQQLRKEYTAAGKTHLFESLQASLSEEEGAGTYSEIAARLDMTEGAVKMSVLRMRRRFGWLLRAEIAQTVPDPQEVEDELRHLLNCLAN